MGSSAIKEMFNQSHPFWTGRASDLMFDGNLERNFLFALFKSGNT